MKTQSLIKRLLSSIVIVLLLVSCSEDTIEEEFFGSLRGTVISSIDGEPLEDVTITTTPSTTTVFTDAQGNFSIPNISVDNYSVAANFTGFDTAFEGVEIFDNQESVVAFELLPTDLSLEVPTAPVLLFPEDGANDLESEVVLEWETVTSNAEILTYDIEIRNSFTNEIRNFSVENDSTLTVSDLDLGATYFWQVSVSDGENDPVLSLIREFSTLSFPSNPFLFVKQEGTNSVIFSGSSVTDTDGTSVDENLFQLTTSSTNSFRPRRNSIAQKIAFLRSVGGDTHLFTMDLTGENVQQVTQNIPVAGFRQDQLDFAWGPNGDYLLYTSFNVLYRINPDGTGNMALYTTSDNSFISEIDIQEFNEDLILIKTNNTQGYDVRIYTLRLSTGEEETIILEGLSGAVGGVEISANGDQVLYSRDTSESQNTEYRLFSSRLFVYDIVDDTTTELATNVIVGENDLDPSFSPSEGFIIFTRTLNNTDAIPSVFTFSLDAGNANTTDQLFTEASMPDWN